MDYIPPETQEPEHVKWMELAMEMAEEAMRACEVPVGCVFVRDGVAIAKARNRTNELRNVSGYGIGMPRNALMCVRRPLGTQSWKPLTRYSRTRSSLHSLRRPIVSAKQHFT